MITPSFSPTATERVLPKLALDFTTARLDPRVTFTRTTDATHPATYVDSNGYVAAATNNQPRFDYNAVTFACKGLLIEESRTNSLTYSEDYTNAAWNKFQSSVAANATTSPSGVVNSCKVVEDSANNAHTIYTSSLSFTSGTAYTLSVFAKAAGRNFCVLDLSGGAFGGIKAYFNLTNGTVGTVVGTGGTFSVVNYGNGWYRCSVTKTATSTTTAFVQLWLASADNVSSYQGNGTDGVYFWGAQLEVGAFPTSYIPTTSAALTRNADVATMTGTNFSDWFNATQGTFAGTVIYTNSVTDAIVISCLPSSGVQRIILYRPATTTTAGFYVHSGSATSALISKAGVVNNQPSTLVGGYKTDRFRVTVNAGTVATDNAGALPTSLISAEIGTLTNGWLQKLSYWPQLLTDNEIQAVSKG